MTRSLNGYLDADDPAERKFERRKGDTPNMTSNGTYFEAWRNACSRTVKRLGLLAAAGFVVPAFVGAAAAAEATPMILGNPEGIDVNVMPITQNTTSVSLKPVSLTLTGQKSLGLSQEFTIPYPSAAIGSVRVGLMLEQDVLDAPETGVAAWLSTPALSETAFTGSLVTARPAAVMDRLGLRQPGLGETTNLAAAVGYAGITVSGAIVEDGLALSPTGQLEPLSSWQAGLAYEFGSMGLSFTYVDTTFMNAEAGAGDGERRSWMLGGLYQLAPNVTLNARAFYVDQNAKMTTPSDLEGSGATVGVRLKF